MATIETAFYVPTFLGLSTTLGISCAVSATCIIAFEICKRLDSMTCLFSPRTQLLENAVPKQPAHLFSWITSTLYIDEKEYVKKVGLDATMHIRFLRMVVHFLTAQAVSVCPILLALHWTGASVSLGTSDLASEFTSLAKNGTSDYRTTPSSLYGGFPSVHSNDTDHFRSNSTLYYLSIANIPNRNQIVWVHVVFAFTISLTWLWLLFVNHMHHIDLLQQQLPTNKLHERSILITHIPHQLRNQATLQQHFERAQVGDVEHVALVSDTAIKSVESVLKKRTRAINKLERWLIDMARIAQRKHRLLQPHKDTMWFDWLCHIKDQETELSLQGHISKVETVLQEIDELGKEIVRLRDINRSPEYYMPTGAAFVTFKSAHSAQICAQIVTSWKPGVFDTRMAPEPRDVLWRSLLRRGRKSRMTGTLRQWVVHAAVWSLTIFWLFPITFILGLTSIQSLSNHFPFLRYFLASSFLVRSFVQNILPTLLVTLFMSLLPWIVLEISKQQDFVSYSELEECVLGRYYHFAIFNVLIVFLLGTTFLTTMLDVLYEPTLLIQLLANALPQGANFFLNYILFNSSTHAMELIQLGSQLFGHVLLTQPIFSKTPRLRRKYTAPWSFLFYYYYPNHILVLVITLTYSVIQPLIMVFALFYFAFALVVYRHQYMYCYIRRYEANGSRHYRRITRYTSDGLLIFQFTMVGLLYLKGVFSAATAILPLIIFTVWCKVKLNRLFQNRTKHPYIGRFQQVNSTNGLIRKEQELQSTHWWRHIDDIWKFSYMKAWWSSGRYAQHNSSNNQPTSMHLSTLEQPVRQATSSVGQSDTNTVVNHTVDIGDADDHKMDILGGNHSAIAVHKQHQRYHDFTAYPDDATSYFETYEHPALIAPLVSDLILPLNPKLHYWNLKQCVYIPIDTVKAIFTEEKKPKKLVLDVAQTSNSNSQKEEC